jgi:hypothetical protein
MGRGDGNTEPAWCQAAGKTKNDKKTGRTEPTRWESNALVNVVSAYVGLNLFSQDLVDALGGAYVDG